MAHLTNYNRKAMGGVLEHNGRQPDDEVTRKNKNIDEKRTHLNYAIWPDGRIAKSDMLKLVRDVTRKSFYKQIKNTDAKRRASGRQKLRKDASIMSSLVVTLPGDYPEGVEQYDFFRGFQQFCIDRYGEGRVGAGFVHMDETNPHMHLPVCPIDKTGCISKKDVFTKADLRSFHSDLQSYMDEYLGFHTTVLLDENALLAKAKSRMTKEEKSALDEHIKAEVDKQVASERAEIRSKASELDKREEALKNGETDFKSRLRNFETQAEDVTNRQMTAEALERANAEKWDAIVRDARELKDEKQAFKEEKRVFKGKKKDLVKREEDVSKREDEVARRETALNDLIKQLGKWWESITNWLDEQFDKARLEEAKRQADAQTSVVVQAVDEFEYESHEDEIRF